MSNIFYNKCFAENGKTVNILRLSRAGSDLLFVHNPDKTRPRVPPSDTPPPRPPLSRDHSGARLWLRCRCPHCLLFVVYSPISNGNIVPLTQPLSIDSAQMFTWPPPSYLHELAFNNKFEEAHLERHFVFMVLHTVFAELEWDWSGCENNLSVFCDNLPAISSLYPWSGIMMDRRSMWVIQTLTARERRGAGHDYLSINIGDIWSWSPAHQELTNRLDSDV